MEVGVGLGMSCGKARVLNAQTVPTGTSDADGFVKEPTALSAVQPVRLPPQRRERQVGIWANRHAGVYRAF